ncbi:ribonuclease kappa-A-like isoform X2 [Antennarius striatus]|uniref:ribonuclease kappa-A-like isoform X2 n=1 Tax=Antennarius striatus TaxID=241820 RepID=UPI0035B097C8
MERRPILSRLGVSRRRLPYEPFNSDASTPGNSRVSFGQLTEHVTQASPSRRRQTHWTRSHGHTSGSHWTMRGLICGPKLAACGMLLSAWGVVMLAMLGIFFSTHSAVLIEDLPLNNQDFNDTNPPQKIYNVYNGVGYNCFIAAAVYVVVGVFSCCQLRLHRTKYLVH